MSSIDEHRHRAMPESGGLSTDSASNGRPMTDASTEYGGVALPQRELRRSIVILLSLVLVIAAAAASLFIVQGVDAQLRDVQRTYEVRRQARELIQSLVDAETGQRGFLLTQDPAYLDPYRSAVTSLDATFNNLMTMLEDNPEAKVRLGALEESIEQKRAEMATTITMASDNRLSEALTILRSDAGRTLMDSIRDPLQAFIGDEDAKLIERNALVDASRLWLTATIIAALGGAAILTYLLFNRTQRQVSTLARATGALQSEKVELEERVQARTAELEEARAHAERERARVEALLQDTSHRIGNSLATVSSMLGLQVARTRSEEVRRALENAQNRVHTIASSHRRLRLGADLETTNAAEFLTSVVEDLESTHAEARPVSFETQVDDMVIHARDATTLGIIVGELVVNALKHAFPDGRSGRVWTRLIRNPEGLAMLVVEDDGRGLPPEPHEPDAGLGAMIIRQLALQFGGEPTYSEREGGGTRVAVSLPKLSVVGPAE
jgi:two-component sensor histidine kinase/CHASE3 domain sensor protein